MKEEVRGGGVVDIHYGLLGVSVVGGPSSSSSSSSSSLSLLSSSFFLLVFILRKKVTYPIEEAEEFTNRIQHHQFTSSCSSSSESKSGVCIQWMEILALPVAIPRVKMPH